MYARLCVALVFCLSAILLFSAILLAQEIPVGTVVPVMLSSGLNAKEDEPGKKIKGSVMQEVSLPDGDKIKERSGITGHVVRTVQQGPSGSSIVIRFDAIESSQRTIPLTASLLAVASASNVDHAQSPINSSSNSEPSTQWVTRQVGGDIVRRGWGKAGSSSGVVGRWVGGTSVVIKLTPNAEAGCPSGPGYDREQAVWAFSSAACGTYGLTNVKIASSGSATPLGEVVLQSTKNILMRGGSGWLLIVVGRQ